jgi:hypothetical protein
MNEQAESDRYFNGDVIFTFRLNFCKKYSGFYTVSRLMENSQHRLVKQEIAIVSIRNSQKTPVNK